MAANNNKYLVLVTGASGYIAGHIIKLLLLQGYKVRGTVRSLKNASEKYKYLFNFPSPIKNNKIELFSADLNLDGGWDGAVKGCNYVIHTASPVLSATGNPNINTNDDHFILPALNGTKRVLNACLKHKNTVKKFICTSSMSACQDLKYKKNRKVIIYTNDIFTDITKTNSSYQKSKTLAEQLVFDFIKLNNYPFQFTTILPGKCIGPLLTDSKSSSMEIIEPFMNGKYPLLPRFQFNLVDVRDVALAHINALSLDENLNGKRYILCNTPIWAGDIGIILKDKYGNNPNYNMSTKVGSLFISDYLFKIIGLFNNMINDIITQNLGKLIIIDTADTIKDLKIIFRPINKSIIDSAESLIKYGFINTVHPSRKSIVFVSGLAIIFLIAAIAFNSYNY